MTVRRIDIGYVCTDRGLVDFLIEVFDLKLIEAMDTRLGTLNRLQGPDSVVKVMVPDERPADVPTADPFQTMAGLRYLTFRVDDLDAAVARAVARGATVSQEPMELPNGVRISILSDPYGNVIEVAQDPD